MEAIVNGRPETTFFVAPCGNDTWSGGLPDPNPTDTDGPFATFQRAQTAVREAKAGGNGPMTVPPGTPFEIDSSVVAQPAGAELLEASGFHAGGVWLNWIQDVDADVDEILDKLGNGAA